jgi:hypothetical protein
MQISPKDPPAKYHVVIAFSQQPPNMCHLPVRCRTDPFYWGCIFKRAGFIRMRNE